MARKIPLILLAVLAALVLAGLGLRWGMLRYQEKAASDPAFFESAIRAFEEADRRQPPAPRSVVFFGSSSIRFWDSLEADMTPLPVVNRGFGGAHLSHLIHNVDRVVLPHAPRAVVVYAGDNDLAAGTGKDVDRVVGDFQRLVRRIHDRLSEAEIFFLSIKPSRLRWDRWPEMSRANREIEILTRSDPRLHFIDVARPLLGTDGRPRADAFVFDGLHLNDRGYAIWTAVVAPVLRSALLETAPRSPSSPEKPTR